MCQKTKVFVLDIFFTGEKYFQEFCTSFFDILIFGVGVGWPSPEIEKYIPRNYIWRIVFSYVLAKSRMPNITNPL